MTHKRTTTPSHRRPEAGSVSVEVAILAPAFLLILVVATMVGRVSVAQGAVTIAAHDAARSASLSRDATTAEQQAAQVATNTLDRQGLACTTAPTVVTDTTEFANAVGQPAQVRVTVWCDVLLTDMAILGLTDTRTVSATFASPLDTWRGRS